MKEATWPERWLLGVGADCAAISGADPRCRATMEDKMARGTDLTLQMSFLPGAERTIYGPRFRFC